MFRRDVGDPTEFDDAVAFAIEADGELAGLIDYHEENVPDFRHAGMDIFLGERRGRGLGHRRAADARAAPGRGARSPPG